MEEKVKYYIKLWNLSIGYKSRKDIMTHEQLEAGADAVARIAAKHGVGAWINRDQEREIAAEVIKAYELHKVKPKAE